MDRRTFLHVAAGFSLGPMSGAFSASAQAAWPSHSMTIIVPFAPGGQADLAARPVALGLAKILGQSVVVDNRAGAGGAIGAAAVAKAEPDGHTMLMALSAIAVLPEAERVSGRKPTLRDVAVHADRPRARRSQSAHRVGRVAVQDGEGPC